MCVSLAFACSAHADDSDLAFPFHLVAVTPGRPAGGSIYGLTPSRCLLPPVYPQQLAQQRGLRVDGIMDALGLSLEIRVELANNDPGMPRLRSVQADEMQTIQGQHRPLASFSSICREISSPCDRT